MRSLLSATVILFSLTAQLNAKPCDALLEKASQLHLGTRTEWLNLLHYQKNIWGRTRSGVIDDHFFFSTNGPIDPTAELEASLVAFCTPAETTADELPACRFPARYAWLKEKLGWHPATDPVCERYEKWRNQMNPSTLSVVFAGYYLSNPASMYGHTFIRMEQATHSAATKMLDYTANYAAEADTNNGLAFAWLGLSGGYQGKFSSIPYYVKIQEYNNLESRDLWEYTLTLSSAAVNRFVQHLWEMGGTSMPYYFLNRNCSYQLLPLLDVAEPSLHLAKQFRIKAIPADTLRAVTKVSGLVTAVSRRPSHVRLMLARRSRLTPTERNIAFRLGKNEGDPAAGLAHIPRERQALILESAQDLFRYRHGFNPELSPKLAQQEANLLRLRSELPATTEPVMPQDRQEAPHLSHGTARIGIGQGWSRHSDFTELRIRSAVHDQVDDSTGFLPGSQLQMMMLQARWDHRRQKIWLDRLTVIDLESYTPWDSWVRKPSWHVTTGFETAYDLPLKPETALTYGVKGGSGLSTKTSFGRGELWTMMLEGDAAIGEPLRDWYRFGGGASVGALIETWPKARVRLTLSWMHYPLGNPGSAVRLAAEQGWRLTKATELRAILRRENHHREALLALQAYF